MRLSWTGQRELAQGKLNEMSGESDVELAEACW